MISDSAMEAAHKAWREQAKQDGSIFEYNLRAAIEAAAPHMLRTVTSVAELDALSVGSVVRSDMGVVWEKDEYTEEPGIPWWSSPGDSHQYPARRISLPATILHEPEAAE